MTSATATAGSGILDRSRRRIAAWVFVLALGGAAVGTAVAVTHDDNTTGNSVPAAVVPTPVASPHGAPATADGAEQWINQAPLTAPPGSRTDSADSFNYKLGPGPR